MNHYAYVTLLSSEDYLPAVLILNQSLKNVNSQFPLLVAVTENIFENVKPYLIQENILYKVIPFLHYSQGTQEKWLNQYPEAKYTLNIASKFVIFKFYEYDKLVFIDSDVLVYQNIDNLFLYPDGAIYDDNGRPFIGLFVFTPVNHNVEYYIALSRMFNVIESNVLEPLFFPFKSNPDYRIPFEYYVNITLDNLDTLNLSDIKVCHFCYKYKPWKYLSADNYLKEFHQEFPNKPQKNRTQIIQNYINNYSNASNVYARNKNFNFWFFIIYNCDVNYIYILLLNKKRIENRL